MKLSVTTLGCPDWSLEEAIERVASYGFDGIDFRGLGGQMDITTLPEFGRDVDATLRQIQEAGLVVSGVSSSVRCLPTDSAQRQGYRDELSRYCELARRLQCQMVRVFGGKVAEGTSPAEALKIAAENLRAYAEIAEGCGVKLAVETHDDWSGSQRMAELLGAVDHPAVGVLWDVCHPWRVTGEGPQQTFETIGRWIVYTHFKDARRRADGSIELCSFGQGDIPLGQCLRVLRDGGYDGWLTFEHEKRWHRELPGPEEAFPRYVEVMRRLLAE